MNADSVCHTPRKMTNSGRAPLVVLCGHAREQHTVGKPCSCQACDCDDFRTADQVRQVSGSESVRVRGVGPDAPIKVNPAGGAQSESGYHVHTLPVRSLLELAKVQHGGDQKYGEFNWRLVDPDEHLNHALVHLLAHLAGDRQDAHLSHAALRVLYALDAQLIGDQL